jgi:hypothetical protein
MQNMQHIQTELNREEMEKNIKDLNEQYNTALEEFNEVDRLFREAESFSFGLLRELYKQFKNANPSEHSSLKELENQYENSLSDIDEKRRKCLDKQSVSFRHLQKLRVMQNTYLVGIINGLQARVSELEDQLKLGSSKLDQKKDNLH